MSTQTKRDYTIEVIVGAFAFMVLLLLGTFTIILSSQNIFKTYVEFDVVFPDVMGLSAGDAVQVRGLDVGKVKHLSLEQDGVHVHVSLDADVQLHTDNKVSIEPGSVLGGKLLTIYEGSSTAPLIPEGGVIYGVPPVDFLDEASQAIQSVRTALEEGGILENLKVTMAEFKTITTRLSKGEGTLGKLLADEEVYTNLTSIVSNLSNVSEKLASGDGTIAQLIDDGTVYEDLKEITSNLKTVSDRLASGKGTIGRLLSEDDTLYENLNTAAEAIGEVASSIRDGKGTLGRLTQDDELYDEVQALLTEVRSLVDDFRETAPITTFSSVFFGAF